MATVKLHYFNARGRAELVRYLLAYNKIAWEDVRYTKEEWQAKKASDGSCPNFPTGQLPVLEINKDGKTYYGTQSLSLARKIARKHNLVGKGEFEEYRCDEVVDALSDLINYAVLAYLEQDAERKEKIKTRLRNEEYPRILGFLEKRLKENGGKHIVGDSWTWADFAVALFIDGLVKRGVDEAKIVEKLPTLSALNNSVNAIPEIAAWIAKRPATEM